MKLPPFVCVDGKAVGSAVSSTSTQASMAERAESLSALSASAGHPESQVLHDDSGHHGSLGGD